MANTTLDITGISFDEPSEGTKVQSRSARYSAEKCVFVDPKTGEEKHFPVQGIVVAATFQKSDSKKPFWDIEIRLTKPSYGLSGGKLVRLEADDTMLIAATKRLMPWVEVAKRDNPLTIPEIWLCPTEKMEIGDGQTLWEYTVRVMAQHDPKKVAAMAALMAEAPVAALPQQAQTSS